MSRIVTLIGIACMGLLVVGQRPANSAADTGADLAGAGSLFERPADQLPQVVPMAELRMDSRTVLARIVEETEDRIRLQTADYGITGYGKDNVTIIRRFEVDVVSYLEELGDYHRGRLWQAEELATAYQRALRAYQEAVARAKEEEVLARIRDKIALLEEAREQWQREELRLAEMRIAREEEELLRLQQETERQAIRNLQSAYRQIHELELQISQLKEAHERVNTAVGEVERLSRSVLRLERLFQDLEEDVDDLQRDLYRLRRRDLTF